MGSHQACTSVWVPGFTLLMGELECHDTAQDPLDFPNILMDNITHPKVVLEMRGKDAYCWRKDTGTILFFKYAFDLCLDTQD